MIEAQIRNTDLDQSPPPIKITSFRRILLREILMDTRAIISLVVLIILMSIIFIGTAILGAEEVLAQFDIFNFNQAPTWWRWGHGPSATGGILGTDGAGRDMLSLLIVSARTSIVIGFSVSIINITIGLIVGLLAGYYGGHFDNVVMRILDMMTIVPTLMVMMVLRIMMADFNIWNMIFIMTIFGWTGRARYIRNLTLGQRIQDYVDASRTLGTRNIMIIIKKIVPNLAAMISADVVLTMSTSIGMETGLTVLGFGLPPGTPSLGNLIANAMVAANMQFRQWNWLPAIILVFVLMCCISYVGQAVSRAANAQQRLS